MEIVAYKLLYESELNHWWDKVRRKIVINFIKRYYSGSTHRPQILDIGCGTGAMAEEVKGIGSYYGLDVSREAVDFCERRGIENIGLGDVRNIPYGENTFDFVLALDVIEHVDDDFLAVKEIRRVLRPGGITIITVPAFKFLWGPTDVFFHHYRRYRLVELESLLKGNNFSILKLSYFNILLFFPIVIIRMIIKLFHLPDKMENNLSRNMINDTWIINKTLYLIFYFESILLRCVNFWFGVSALAIGRKK